MSPQSHYANALYEAVGLFFCSGSRWTKCAIEANVRHKLSYHQVLPLRLPNLYQSSIEPLLAILLAACAAGYSDNSFVFAGFVDWWLIGVANSIFRRDGSLCRKVDRDTDGTIRACVVRDRIPTGSQIPRNDREQGG